ncbi:Outer membrane protein [Trichinella pseudospiralis]
MTRDHLAACVGRCMCMPSLVLKGASLCIVLRKGFILCFLEIRSAFAFLSRALPDAPYTLTVYPYTSTSVALTVGHAAFEGYPELSHYLLLALMLLTKTTVIQIT